MHRHFVAFICSFAVLTAFAGSAGAQTTGTAGSQDRDWKFTIYPVLAWVPTHIAIDVNVPPIGNGGGNSEHGAIIDSRFDGAYLGGFSATNSVWRIDADGLWAGVGGDRAERPRLVVDADLTYLHISGGRALFKGFYVTAGLRRMAIDYEIHIADRPTFTRKPGVWDPLIGAGWHQEGRHFEAHAVAEGGGFGVGADSDFGATFRLDWKPVSHFGVTGGYSLLKFKVSEDIGNSTFIAKETLHGPVVGIGLYF